MKKNWMIRIVPLLLIVMAGCEYESFDYASELDAVVTAKSGSDGYDYKANRTWTMPTEVLDLGQYAEDSIALPHRYDDLILSTITDNMDALGYTYVPWPEVTDTDSDTDDTGTTPPVAGLPDGVDDLDVDLIVLPGIVATENWAYYGYYYYYGYYWYGYYPSYTVAVNYEAGSMLISMLDKSETLELDNGDSVYLPVWTAAMTGLLDYIDGDKISNGINQAFKQSPYLDVTDAGGN